MRRIIYVYSTHCPRCSFVETKIIDRVRQVYPDRVEMVNGDMDRAMVKKYKIKGAPTILYMDGDKEAGRTVNQHWTADKIVRWFDRD